MQINKTKWVLIRIQSQYFIYGKCCLKFWDAILFFKYLKILRLEEYCRAIWIELCISCYLAIPRLLSTAVFALALQDLRSTCQSVTTDSVTTDWIRQSKDLTFKLQQLPVSVSVSQTLPFTFWKKIFAIHCCVLCKDWGKVPFWSFWSQHYYCCWFFVTKLLKIAWIICWRKDTALSLSL